MVAGLETRSLAYYRSSRASHNTYYSLLRVVLQQLTATSTRVHVRVLLQATTWLVPGRYSLTAVDANYGVTVNGEPVQRC